MNTPYRLRAFLFVLCLIAFGLLARVSPAAAQDSGTRVERLTGRLEVGEADGFLLRDLRAGDRLTVSMRTLSGNLDPLVGISDADLTLQQTLESYRADVQALVAANENLAERLPEVRDKHFLAWDDDSGDGYAAALSYVIPADGDYQLFAASALSAFGRATFGEYELLVGLNVPEGSETGVQPTGAPFIDREQNEENLTASVQAVTGAVTTDVPVTSLRLGDIEAGDTLYVFVERTSGDLAPAVILRDYGGKPLQAENLDAEVARAAFEYAFTEDAAGYTLDIRAGNGPDGATSTGDFRALVGLNAPDVLTGQAEERGHQVINGPIDVQVGIKVERISEVDSQNERFTVLSSLRMDWTDPALAFSPDTCNCTVKLYTEKEFDRFLSDVQSRWPDFVLFNQYGNRWTQSRAAAVWPDGRARYAETFTTTFQADFDFRLFPFDTQEFPIYIDLLYPTTLYTLSALPNYTEINPDHGEDEFIVTDFTTGITEVPGGETDNLVSRFNFAFAAPRHLNYYVLQIFVPILLIILISWFTFFLRDYTRRIEAAAANILLFIAFSFSLADNYPRLGYVTFLDAIMAVTFIVNTLVLLYNVYMKRLENEGKDVEVERIDRVMDWAYPLMYLVLIGVVAMAFFT